MTGRPTLYTAEIAERILGQLSNGRSLPEVCGDRGMPSPSTVRQWVAEDREGFAARYKRVRETCRVKPGPDTTYTACIADRILEELSDGRTLAEVCRDPGMPARGTVRHWVSENRDGFAARYKRAREAGYYAMADQILEIADDSRNDWILRRKPDGKIETVLNHENIRDARLRIVARCWLLAKAMPRHYGHRRDLIERHEPRDTLAAMMKEIEERNRKRANLAGQQPAPNLSPPMSDLC
jgi:hypothetical protein